MQFLFIALIGIIMLFVIINLGWRILSQNFNLPCPSWLKWLVEFENPFIKSHQSSYILKNLNVKKGMKVLDVGCGPGRITIPLSRIVGTKGKVVAIDLQSKMLEAVKKKAVVNKLKNIEYLNIPMGKGKLKKQNADRAVLATVLGEIPEKERALKEIYHSLKKGGILAITELIFDPHFQLKGKVLNLAKHAGFKEKLFFGNKLAYTVYLKKQ